MLLSAVSVFVVAQSSSEIPEGLMNNHVDQSAKNVAVFQNIWNAILLCGFHRHVTEKYIILGSDATSIENQFRKFQKEIIPSNRNSKASDLQNVEAQINISYG